MSHILRRLAAIDDYYENIVGALSCAASTTVLRVPNKSLKPYWNKELEKLKNDSMFWHGLWIDAGRPSSGSLHHIRLSCKAKYKLAVRNAYLAFENSLSDELYTHYINKNFPDFWKTWKVKFHKNINKSININGCMNDEDIANEFARNFNTVFVKRADYDDYEDTYVTYLNQREKCINDKLQSSIEFIESITVESIDRCIRGLKLGKACGPDDLCSEHLIYAHPSLTLHFMTLFRLMSMHAYVPNGFGVGISIPLIKDKSGNINDADNYRAITLSPVISKLFEKLLLTLCDSMLSSDPLQFGFKQHIGCNDAIFTLKSTIEYFVSRGSSVYIASLDISKAFDRVHHFKLFNSLLLNGVPVIVVDMLCDWYSKLFFTVRWNNKISSLYPVGSGVRQGSCLSPAIFNVFINAFIVHLKASSLGCHVSSIFLGCLLYADDIILICPSIAGLQSMLDKCAIIAHNLSLQFNTKKCHCIVFGKLFNTVISSMKLCGSSVEWCNAIKYLGVHLLSSRELKFDISHCRRAFYAACNSIFTHGSDVNELALLTLQESYSLPILMYAAPALSLTKRQISELNVCWNNVFRKLFGYNKWESVKAVIFGLGRLNIYHLVSLRKVRFYRHLYLCKNSFMTSIFRVFLLHLNDSLMCSVFKEYDEVLQDIYDDFRVYASV